MKDFSTSSTAVRAYHYVVEKAPSVFAFLRKPMNIFWWLRTLAKIGMLSFCAGVWALGTLIIVYGPVDTMTTKTNDLFVGLSVILDGIAALVCFVLCVVSMASDADKEVAKGPWEDEKK